MRKLDLKDIVGTRKKPEVTLKLVSGMDRFVRLMQSPLSPRKAWNGSKRSAILGDLIHEIFDRAEFDENGQTGEFGNLGLAKLDYAAGKTLGQFAYSLSRPPLS